MEISDIVAQAASEGRSILNEYEAKTVLKRHSIPTTEIKLARTLSEALKAAKEIGYPVVMKVVSPEITHKTDVGGVVLNIDSDEKLAEEYELMLKRVREAAGDVKILGVTVQEQVDRGVELMIGAIRDPQFGPVLALGIGGVFVEVYGDVAYRVAPVSRDDVLDMISELKGRKLLEGFRGLPPVDLEAVISMMLKISDMIIEHEEIAEMDLNPVIFRGSAGKVVDARVRIVA
ncbi:MAG: acetyl-CoA synthetase [Thermoproteota archaeon]|nr:MAG: acetyl-CoA synthetase [Candidatus Korarchaeota archaeon]